MYTDCHVHTDFSSDSSTPVTEQIERAIALGMKTLYITDHQDFDFPEEVYGMSFTFDTDAYFDKLNQLKESYAKQIELRIGIELGLQEHLPARLNSYVQSYPFDYIIGSIHLIRKIDPYYAEFYEGRSEEEAYREYFETTLENIKLYTNFDAMGHLDYIVRYGPNKNKYYTYQAYQDIIDEILCTLIQNNIALECNTAGIKYGLNHPNPHPDVIKRYLELGGEMITLGSDGHQPSHLAYAFTDIKDILLECGVKYLTLFKNRKPEFVKL